MRSSIGNVALGVAWVSGSLCLALAGCVPMTGGCPWTETSAVELSPSTACLTLSLADASGRGDSTGCVAPVLVGENHCSEPLALPVSASAIDSALMVEPGERFTFEVSLDSAIEDPNDDFRFAVVARLGAEPLSIRFRTWLN